MKKSLLTGLCAAAVLAFVQSASAQGYVYLNSYDSGVGFVSGTGSQKPYTISDNLGSTTVYFQLLSGGSATTVVNPVISTALGGNGIYTCSANDFDGNGPGTGLFFDVGAGLALGSTVSGPGYFELFAWTGNADRSLATKLYDSGVWTQTVGNNPAAPANPTPAALQIPATQGSFAVLVTPTAAPEPSTFALAGLGAAAMMIFRRRK